MSVKESASEEELRNAVVVHAKTKEKLTSLIKEAQEEGYTVCLPLVRSADGRSVRYTDEDTGFICREWRNSQTGSIRYDCAVIKEETE